MTLGVARYSAPRFAKLAVACWNTIAPVETSPVSACSTQAAANEPVNVSVLAVVFRLNLDAGAMATWPIDCHSGGSTIGRCRRSVKRYWPVVRYAAMRFD